MNFDRVIDRRGTHSQKWDEMEKYAGVSADTGLAMWVADMEFRPPVSVQNAVEKMAAHGVYGYFGDNSQYLEAIQWWVQSRHGWTVEKDEIFTTHGLVNGAALCVDVFTAPGDGVVLVTPVYHAFARVTKAAGRAVVECPLKNEAGSLKMDFDAWDTQMTGREKMLILCSPHNPGGRVWTLAELQGVAAFCQRHDLILLSDEIHCDLVYPGYRHIAMTNAAPDVIDRLVMMTATTKTFNIASVHTGNVIIPDPDLRKRFGNRMMALGISANGFAGHIVPAAYSPEGAKWVDELMIYLDGNRKLFDEGVNAIPGLASMRLEATYLAWVDFSGTGLEREEFIARVARAAQIATSPGITFGCGGESFLRFNIGAPRALVTEAVARLQRTFSDLR